MPFTTTNADFNTMLKEYMPYELLFEEVMKRDYFLGKVDKDKTWKGGTLRVPFMGAHASSFAYGQMTLEDEINEDKPVNGTVTDYKEIWGSMVFNDHDLARHGDMKQSFLKILPDRLEAFIGRMKEVVSVNLLNGTHHASLVLGEPGEDLANGVVAVDRPARLSIGQFFEVGVVGQNKAAGENAQDGLYVGQIDISAKLITLYTDKALTATANLAALNDGGAGPTSVAAGDKLFVKGASIAGRGFTSLREQLLAPGVPGASSTLFGISKLAYPHLQAVNIDGTAEGIVANNFLEKLFDAYNVTREVGKGNPTDYIMSYKRLAHCMRNLELGESGGYGRDFRVADTRVNAFGWTEIDVVGVKGKLTIVGVQEMDDDIVYMIDWSAVKLFSNDFFERRTAPDGKQFYEIRATDGSGYKYIIDTRFFGELIVSKPSHCGVIHSLNF